MSRFLEYPTRLSPLDLRAHDRHGERAGALHLGGRPARPLALGQRQVVPRAPGEQVGHQLQCLESAYKVI